LAQCAWALAAFGAAPQVSETDVGRADQQHAGWIERDEFPAFDHSRVILVR
jgi:hypothetical protein